MEQQQQQQTKLSPIAAAFAKTQEQEREVFYRSHSYTDSYRKSTYGATNTDSSLSP